MPFTWLMLHMHQDKWRNLSVNHASQGSKEKSRTSKSKAFAVAQRLNIQNSAPATSLRYNASPVAVMDDPSNSLQDGKNVPRCVFIFCSLLLTVAYISISVSSTLSCE